MDTQARSQGGLGRELSHASAHGELGGETTTIRARAARREDIPHMLVTLVAYISEKRRQRSALIHAPTAHASHRIARAGRAYLRKLIWAAAAELALEAPGGDVLAGDSDCVCGCDCCGAASPEDISTSMAGEGAHTRTRGEVRSRSEQWGGGGRTKSAWRRRRLYLTEFAAGPMRDATSGGGGRPQGLERRRAAQHWRTVRAAGRPGAVARAEKGGGSGVPRVQVKVSSRWPGRLAAEVAAQAWGLARRWAGKGWKAGEAALAGPSGCRAGRSRAVCAPNVGTRAAPFLRQE